jgi:hypothetical protein
VAAKSAAQSVLSGNWTTAGPLCFSTLTITPITCEL